MTWFVCRPVWCGAQRIGEDHLAHSLMTFNTTYKVRCVCTPGSPCGSFHRVSCCPCVVQDSGLFGVYAVAEPQNVEQCFDNIMAELRRLSEKVTEDEVARARTKLKATLLSQLDGSTAVCEDIGRQLLTFGRRMTPAELFMRVDAVDATAVLDAARSFIHGKVRL